MLLVVVLASLYLSSAAASTPLAAERTRRKDPLDGLRLYGGGWNISDRHYIAVGSVPTPAQQLVLCFCLYVPNVQSDSDSTRAQPNLHARPAAPNPIKLHFFPEKKKR
jgi:hypothetical protein